MKKLTRTPTKPETSSQAANRVTRLDDIHLAKVIGGCTNENLTEAVFK
jgi:hypothetical protein